MYYHPIIGISIFIIAVVISFILGRIYIKKLNLVNNNKVKNKSLYPGRNYCARCPLDNIFYIVSLINLLLTLKKLI